MRFIRTKHALQKIQKSQISKHLLAFLFGNDFLLSTKCIGKNDIKDTGVKPTDYVCPTTLL